jgi:tetratricopeptide (TPR) repeat protein
VEGARDLPSPLRGMARAAAAAARDATAAAIASLDGVIGEVPSLSEARAFRARLLLGDCSSYDLDVVRSDVRAALLSNPCCASCDLTVAETEAFAGRPLDGVDLLSARGCASTALDSARERALSLLLAASGNRKDAMEAAARAEAKDVSALRRGLAPAFMLVGDNAHLEEAYDSESDLRVAPNVSIEQHLYAGLNALWTGRPSAAAFQFERALEHVRAHSPGEPATSSMSPILTTLRIRSYLAAGRLDEAKRAAAEAAELARDRAQGLLEYTIALTAIAGGEDLKALTMIRASGRPSEKIWSYLTQAQVSLGAGRAKDALESVNLALAGIGSQVAVCPGLSTEPYLLEPQARTLLAEGRPAESLRVLDRLFALGSRGLFAPDVIAPAWLVAGQAREAMGDVSGARKAYTALLDLWGKGEETPATLKAKERLAALP